MSSLSLQFTPLFSPSLHQRHFYKPLRLNPLRLPPPKPPGYLAIVRSLQRDTELLPLPPPPQKQTGRLEKFVSTAAGLFPLYITSGGIIACMKPSTFSWFVQRGPGSYSLALSLVMLAMGLTLELKDLFNLFMQRPLAILYVCVAQYTIMPVVGAVIGKFLGLPPGLSVGLILLGCCPGGIASSVVTLIAKGDVPLSIIMTVCTTLEAVVLTPFLTRTLVGASIPVDAIKLSLSTLQVVVVPILIGSYLQKACPGVVKRIVPFSPLFAVLTSSLLACRFSFSLYFNFLIVCALIFSLILVSFISVFSENIVRLKSSVLVSSSLGFDASPWIAIKTMLSRELGVVILAVFSLHLAGFIAGYTIAAIGGFRERERRAISLEVGMQNSSLGVVLATAHFSSAMVALPAAMSAVIMNMMGSSLGSFWRNIEPSAH
ncbi:putative sodium/metabolite cotransporter BASS1 [Cucumis melo var. makuwa]|uniref:Sodium/metabolite cotransporter BASS1 n=1 Tax=Cucumis melo var. makuwa TaxID=1194695 RepID=A0A5A7V423_CUCMM|nr:putative sodium/metabolite cotransporter BASS1 [Cucumis melo var. makuwa]TYK02257.1 putative sodium/metabolite cotransporter BASS1 [Cucumis melo var. makuwa]